MNVAEKTKEVIMTDYKDDDQNYKPIHCFISEKAFHFLSVLTDRLGWNQHDVITKAIEILWQNEEGPETKDKTVLESLLESNQMLAKKMEELEKKMEELETKK